MGLVWEGKRLLNRGRMATRFWMPLAIQFLQVLQALVVAAVPPHVNPMVVH